MRTRWMISCPAVLALVYFAWMTSNAAEPGRMYNTAKQKLMDGKPIIGGTVYTSDPNIYCAMADAGFDFLWIEMQHSPLTYSDVAKMIRACKGAKAIPFIRVPDATEGDIQKATDIGALGIIVPMVASVEEAEAAVRYAKYPPQGRRSRGGGQYGELWGEDYRETVNDNMMVVAMIESPDGIEIADQIAAVPGVDVVFAASGDIGSFTGYAQDDPRYQTLVDRIRDETLKAGKKLGGPFNWHDREGFSFFQASSEAGLIQAGAKALLETAKGAYEY
ncbi:MAG TPA: aldolase/citrate lyase family protein [Vicinamibacteria bacterium]|nr:aldolase/citrate lyase family protein [Vicinamibacteria bacterium]